MVCSGFEPGTAWWKVQTNAMSPTICPRLLQFKWICSRFWIRIERGRIRHRSRRQGEQGSSCCGHSISRTQSTNFYYYLTPKQCDKIERFWKFSVTKLLIKVAKMTIKSFFKNIIFFKFTMVTFWATFYSNIWSLCTQLGQEDSMLLGHGANILEGRYSIINNQCSHK